MSEWYRLVQTIVEEVDECIAKRDDETLTLSKLSKKNWATPNFTFPVNSERSQE